MDFRKSFKKMAQGGHPDSPDWKRKANFDWSNAGQWGTDLFLEEQTALLKILAQADLAAIAKVARFPDWLGYLGLALGYTEQVEREDRLATMALARQLLEMVEDGTHAASMLSALAQGEGGILAWSSLESVESSM